MWYIMNNGQQVGPMPAAGLVSYGLNPSSMVWRQGMAQWMPAGSCPELAPYMQGGYSYAHPGNPGAQSYNQPGGYQAQPYKDKTTAGILAILFGSLGVQYFYIGKVGGGFLTILLELVTCGLWSIVVLIQGIMMLTMSQQEFDAKFVYTDKTLPLF
ncbi:MAG: DUF4339 domain-containing protein [Bacteroidales bacterium]|nr:DUF4339 domain-containing protein [Bacteroidales bacterium]MBD5221957.1 DUF4339 domain-containing protein [Bacteroidales bacterium]